MKYKFETRNYQSPLKIADDDESRNFSDLKKSNLEGSLVKPIDIDKLYEEFMAMDHNQLVECCLDFKQKLTQTSYSSRNDKKPRPSSAVRSSMN